MSFVSADVLTIAGVEVERLKRTNTTRTKPPALPTAAR
jgi:hypothetical protein